MPNTAAAAQACGEQATGYSVGEMAGSKLSKFFDRLGLGEQSQDDVIFQDPTVSARDVYASVGCLNRVDQLFPTTPREAATAAANQSLGRPSVDDFNALILRSGRCDGEPFDCDRAFGRKRPAYADRVRGRAGERKCFLYRQDGIAHRFLGEQCQRSAGCRTWSQVQCAGRQPVLVVRIARIGRGNSPVEHL